MLKWSEWKSGSSGEWASAFVCKFYAMPNFCIRASCRTCEKLMSAAVADSFSHSGMVSVFLTDFALFRLWYFCVSHRIIFINSSVLSGRVDDAAGIGSLFFS